MLSQWLRFFHANGNGSQPPVQLLHDWPKTFVDFEGHIAPLIAVGHDVVVPSLPGYSFIGKSASPIGATRTAELMFTLMVMQFEACRYFSPSGTLGCG